MRLDDTDWAIIRDLYRWDTTAFPRGPLRIPLRELADRTGIHRNTVQARLAAMRKAGVLEGTVFEPRPGPLGLQRSGYLFTGPGLPDGAGVLKALESFPSISAVVLCLGTTFVHMWHPQSADVKRDAEAVRQALGCGVAIEGYHSGRFSEEEQSSLTLSRTDGRLILALRRNPSQSMAAVARDLGTSTRTAERRAEQLITRGGGAMVPLLRPGLVEGCVVAQYIARPGTTASTLANAFPDRVIGPFGPEQIPSVMVVLPSVAAVESRRHEAERRPGVGGLDVVLLQDVVYPAAFEGWLAERVESVQRPRTSKQ